MDFFDQPRDVIINKQFVDQPRDVIINHELIHLPIKDLLISCQTNPLFDQLCKDPDLWRARIRNDYPEVNLRDIKDPRAFYLKQLMFGGQIYIHDIIYPQGLDKYDQTITNPELPAGTSMIPYEIIPYNDLFTRVKEIAERYKPAGNEYFIVYSRPTANVNKPGLTYLAFQDENDIELELGPAQKITLVDILYLLPGSLLLRMFNNLLVRKYEIEQNPGLAPHRIRRLEGEIKHINHVIEGELSVLLKYHSTANTRFYQTELNYVINQIRAKALNPEFPGISNLDTSRDIESRKKALLDFVLATVPNYGAGSPVLGFVSYPEFVIFQEDYIDNISEDQLKALEVLIMLSSNIVRHPSSLAMDTRIEMMRGFAFDSNGDIALISGLRR